MDFKATTEEIHVVYRVHQESDGVSNAYLKAQGPDFPHGYHRNMASTAPSLIGHSQRFAMISGDFEVQPNFSAQSC